MGPLRIAIAGLGTVGGGVVRLLKKNEKLIEKRAGRPIVLTTVSARDRKKAKKAGLDVATWVADPRDLTKRKDVDVVVELLGGAEGLARQVCEAALANGKSVVTANKALLAAHGFELARLAEKNKGHLLFEAAVGGGIPVIKTMREALAGNEVSSVRGILNGTCNYILTRMSQEGLSFEEALRQAQALGYAEADPSADIEGRDAAHKLAILASLSFGTRPDLNSVQTMGLSRLTPMDFSFAEELGCRIKLLGVAKKTAKGVEQRVEPCLVPFGSPLANIEDVLNAVQIQGDAVGPLTLVGRGAGAEATASAVIGDIMDLARGAVLPAWTLPAEKLQKNKALSAKDSMGRFYIRLDVSDRAGVLADLAGALRDSSISIETLLQHGRAAEGKTVPLVIVTHETNADSLRRALIGLKSLKTVRAAPLALRIEGENHA